MHMHTTAGSSEYSAAETVRDFFLELVQQPVIILKPLGPSKKERHCVYNPPCYRLRLYEKGQNPHPLKAISLLLQKADANSNVRLCICVGEGDNTAEKAGGKSTAKNIKPRESTAQKNKLYFVQTDVVSFSYIFQWYKREGATPDCQHQKWAYAER